MYGTGVDGSTKNQSTRGEQMCGAQAEMNQWRGEEMDGRIKCVVVSYRGRVDWKSHEGK